MAGGKGVMNCLKKYGKRSKAFLLISALLLSQSLPLYSQSAEDEETAQLLSECVQHLEAQTNATENVLSENERQQNLIAEYRTLTGELMSAIETRDAQLSERDERLKRAEVSFSEYVDEQRGMMIRNTAIGVGLGFGIGSLFTLLLH